MLVRNLSLLKIKKNSRASVKNVSKIENRQMEKKFILKISYVTPTVELPIRKNTTGCWTIFQSRFIRRQWSLILVVPTILLIVLPELLDYFFQLHYLILSLAYNFGNPKTYPY